MSTGTVWVSTAWAATAWELGAWEQEGAVPVIVTTDLPNAAQNVDYSASITSTGDTPITYAVTVGALPTGISMSTAGVFTGIPTVLETQTFTVTATNTQGTDTEEYTIIVGTVSSGDGAARDGRRSVSRGLLRIGGRG